MPGSHTQAGRHLDGRDLICEGAAAEGRGQAAEALLHRRALDHAREALRCAQAKNCVREIC